MFQTRHKIAVLLPDILRNFLPNFSSKESNIPVVELFNYLFRYCLERVYGYAYYRECMGTLYINAHS